MMTEEMKGLTPDDTLQLVLHSKSKDGQDFFASSLLIRQRTSSASF